MKSQIATTAELIRDFEIALPWPDPILWPNRSMGHHWAKRSDARTAARAVAGFESIGHWIGSNVVDHAVTIIVHPPDRKRRDLDGILSALKPTLDGLADGLQINDFNFNPITIRREGVVTGGSITIIVHGATA